MGLYQAREAKRLKVKDVAVADHYHMHENNLCSEASRAIMKNYIAQFMIANKEKHYLHVPYVPYKSFSSYFILS